LRGRFWLGIGLVVLATVVLPSCNQIVNYPAPRIQSLMPSTMEARKPQFTLTVTGYQLTPASTVTWNGSPLITYFQTTNELTAQVPASFIQNPGSVAIQIFTPQPGGGSSTSLIFTITPPPTPVPQITSISPTGVLAGSNSFQLLITGTNFVGSSTVTVNGVDRGATVLNPTSIEVAIIASDVALAGTVQIAVVNPIGPPTQPGGGSSSPVSLVVTNPVPTISSVSPTGLAAGATANATLQVSGTSFVPNSVIEIDGASPASGTTFGSTTQVSAILTPGDLAAAAVHRLQVVNPGPGGGSSNVITYAVDPSLTHGLPVLLDYGYNGYEANAGICGPNCTAGPLTLATAGPSVNMDGSVVVYASTSTNLLKNQANTGSDIFSRTTCLTTAPCTPTTTDVSVGPNNAVSNGSSWEPSVDDGATHVAFTSTASNLVAGVSLATGSRQVYWMPICDTTTAGSTCSAGQLASLSADGITPGDGNSYNPSISPDGRYVAFVSLATDLVSGLATLDGKTPQVFLRDTCNGLTSTACTPTTYLVSTPDGTTPGDGPSSLPTVSNDGEYVSFTSTATNLGATAPNSGGAQEIFERATCLPTVTTCAAITTLISTPDGVTPANGSSSESKIASGGRFIVFASTATNLQTGAGPVQQIYMYDTCLSAGSGCIPGVTLISTPDGTTPGNGTSEYPAISLGTGAVTVSATAGEFVAFASRASNLSANTANGVENIFVREACVGFSSTLATCTPTTALASQPAGTSPPEADGDSLVPALSGNAHTVAFISSANNLVANDTNGFPNLFLALTSF
jgi:trimeric autotransporter adhesin